MAVWWWRFPCWCGCCSPSTPGWAQVLLASTLWKVGALFGALWGAIAGANRGLDSRLARRYSSNLEAGALALAAKVAHRDAPPGPGNLHRERGLRHTQRGRELRRSGWLSRCPARNRPASPVTVPVRQFGPRISRQAHFQGEVVVRCPRPRHPGGDRVRPG